MKKKNIYNKVKTWALALALVSASTGTFTSCNDFLEVEPQDLITLEKFWNSKSDVENVVSGCYAELASYDCVARILMWGEFRSENVINRGTLTDANLQRVLREDINASNGYTTWNNFYTVINRCNTVIKYAPAVSENDPSYTQSQVDANIAEVTALRSLCYFYLIRTFRDVPYTTEAYIDDSQTLALPQTSFDAVLDSCIISLESVQNKAIEKYAATSTEAKKYYNTGRITRLSIWAMLCDMYLWKQDYDNCIKYADLIIDYKKKEAEEEGYTESDFENFNGYPLLTNCATYGDYFGYAFTSIFGTGNSMESIFELSYLKNDKSSQANDLAAGWFGNATDAGTVKPSTYVALDESDNTSPVVFDAKNNFKDIRGYVNFINGNASIGKYGYTSFVVETVNGANTVGIASGIYDKAGSNNPNKSNVIIYRLADIMLMKAEALTQKMSSEGSDLSDEDVALRNEAFELVDAVNKRSVMEKVPKSVLSVTDYNTKDKITDLVYEERERELIFEGKRFYDLVRRSLRENNTDYLADHVCHKDDDLETAIRSKMTKMDAIFWPINNDEIKANPLLKQNSAFGSGESSSMKKG